MGLKGIAKHSENMACVVVNQGGLDAALTCLEDFDVGVKESGAWVIASIARHSEKMASKIAALGNIILNIISSNSSKYYNYFYRTELTPEN